MSLMALIVKRQAREGCTRSKPKPESPYGKSYRCRKKPVVAAVYEPNEFDGHLIDLCCREHAEGYEKNRGVTVRWLQ